MNRTQPAVAPRDFDFYEEARAVVARGRVPFALGGTDDDARALVAIADAGLMLRAAHAATMHRALNRLYDAQNRDGGWGPNPQASCPEHTGRALDALGRFGLCAKQDVAARAITFLLANQDEGGGWRDACGARPVACSAAVLAGLCAVGFDVTAPAARRAARVLKELQLADGGWGSAHETAEALLGLLSACDGASAEARAGAEYLVATQRETGAWPGGARALPVRALTRYLEALGVSAGGSRRDAPHAPRGPKFAA
jgi:squalene-hopene/tetraprenyl-beta-curcumene cyclase